MMAYCEGLDCCPACLMLVRCGAASDPSAITAASSGNVEITLTNFAREVLRQPRAEFADIQVLHFGLQVPHFRRFVADDEATQRTEASQQL